MVETENVVENGDTNDTYEKRYARFRAAREKKLELVETFEGDVGYVVIRDVNTGEIFNCWYKVKPGKESDQGALKFERKMNKALKQWLQENNIILIVESPGTLIEYNEMERGDAK